MSASSFYRQGTADQVVVNLFYGWGYNFYRVENQLRADDLLVRAKVSAMLGAARGGVEAAEAAFRRERLPPLSRAKPLPDPDAVRDAQAIEALGRELGAAEGAIRALPAPENDRMTQLYRDEAAFDAHRTDPRMPGVREKAAAMLDGQTITVCEVA